MFLTKDDFVLSKDEVNFRFAWIRELTHNQLNAVIVSFRYEGLKIRIAVVVRVISCRPKYGSLDCRITQIAKSTRTV